MKRREFITLLGGAAASWPIAARAQQPAMPLIGFLHSASPETRRDQVVAFRQGLKDAGFVEGENVAIEYRWAGDQYDRLPELAADLVRRRVAVIAATGNIATALAAKARTTTIPIVFMNSGDPVQAGLVASLNRPGGNVTGVSNMAVELGAKQLGLLHELVPGDALIAVLVNPNSPITESFIADLRLAASAIGRQIEILTATTNREIDAAFAGLTQKQIRALVVGLDTLFLSRRVQLITLTTRHAVPTMHPFREDVEAGGLMSYGPSNLDQYRHAGVYTGRILKGEKPAETPVQRPTKFEFVINLQTAKVIGIEVPPTLLARADEVDRMKRREFITLLGGAAVAWPIVTRAQQPAKMLRVGTVAGTPKSSPHWVAFERRMGELGYQEGKNFSFDFLQAASADEYEVLYRKLAAQAPDVILAIGPEIGLRSALAATRTLPIVMIAIDYDPLARGYVTSLARPSGNVTGVVFQQIELAAKRIQLIKDNFPDRPTATMFWDELSADQWEAARDTAATLGLQLFGIELHESPYDYEAAFGKVPLDHRGMLIIPTSPSLFRDRARLADFALKHRILSMFVFREWVDAGGLLCYGPSITALFARVAEFVDRIARGAVPSDLPIEQPTKFEMVVNLKTAKAIGVDLPTAILLRADEVIE